MRVFVQSQNYPGQVLFAFDDVVTTDVTRVRWAVAYATARGCARLIARVSEKMSEERWAECEKRFVISLDFGLTEPAALEILAAQPNSRVRVAGVDALDNAGLFPFRTYHPKIFLFHEADEIGYVVGSANLTESALITNTEVVAAGSDSPENCEWQQVWDELVVGTAKFDDAILTAYKKRWRPIPRPVVPDPSPPAIEIDVGEKPTFWDAIEDGVDPSDFVHFWVEAGSMSSGGSHNQLELPRGANRFFGYDFSDYGSDHQLIGYPQVTVRSRHWNDRPLTWHGNNRMERINLPTASQGGENYVNTAILFRRRGRDFELRVAPWNDTEAIAWRTASENEGQVFRLGKVGKRLCGLF